MIMATLVPWVLSARNVTRQRSSWLKERLLQAKLDRCHLRGRNFWTSLSRISSRFQNTPHHIVHRFIPCRIMHRRRPRFRQRLRIHMPMLRLLLQMSSTTRPQWSQSHFLSALQRRSWHLCNTKQPLLVLSPFSQRHVTIITWWDSAGKIPVSSPTNIIWMQPKSKLWGSE